jgi:DNA-directed RNA polymerase subunit F
MAKQKNSTKKITTIKLLEETKLRIEKLRENKGESYDDILRKILYVLNTARDDPEKARKILEKISNLRTRMIEEEIQQKEDLEKEKGGENGTTR